MVSGKHHETWLRHIKTSKPYFIYHFYVMFEKTAMDFHITVLITSIKKAPSMLKFGVCRAPLPSLFTSSMLTASRSEWKRKISSFCSSYSVFSIALTFRLNVPTISQVVGFNISAYSLVTVVLLPPRPALPLCGKLHYRLAGLFSQFHSLS